MAAQPPEQRLGASVTAVGERSRQLGMAHERAEPAVRTEPPVRHRRRGQEVVRVHDHAGSRGLEDARPGRRQLDGDQRVVFAVGERERERGRRGHRSRVQDAQRSAEVVGLEGEPCQHVDRRAARSAVVGRGEEVDRARESGRVHADLGQDAGLGQRAQPPAAGPAHAPEDPRRREVGVEVPVLREQAAAPARAPARHADHGALGGRARVAAAREQLGARVDRHQQLGLESSAFGEAGDLPDDGVERCERVPDGFAEAQDVRTAEAAVTCEQPEVEGRGGTDRVALRAAELAAAIARGGLGRQVRTEAGDQWPGRHD